ncbi:allophanate hydrolase [Pseudarthrobacter sp. NIBRBAC000502771]|uniref:allophanate hydrolase n=1 Tax=Pseudarthrobacter sp. NIBRBAC000502771 TaxID=2590774 RepID=UPI00113162B6|nr:allophanate hydrolase [Pseudarthrobacter sp. NIBRBAC000502771]QDG61539.1 allophanate hydrolase [Pseudarthrobacter sp. NIBRBAC000502771]
MNPAPAGAATRRAEAALAAVDAVDRPEIWITLRGREDVVAEAATIDAAVARGAHLPLAGLVLAVKNNVDVAGIPTTAACPGFAYVPEQDAEAVARLRAAGALVLGATNLDQFATGLVGTRSPYGAVRDSRRPEYISGGSSSGSAVAVALGLVDIAIGTDTAGSGRVPAGLQGIVGIKGTLNLVSTAGVVPACRSWDAVTIFARDLASAELAMGIMAGGARAWPADTKLGAPSRPRVAYPASLPALPPGWAAEFQRQVDRLRSSGVDAEAIEFDAFLQAARLLYDGALVAERHAAVGDFLARHDAGTDGRAGIDPTVEGIIRAAGTVSASRYVADTARLEELKATAMARLQGFDALLVPTAPFHPTLAEVAADPVGVNSLMGTYTNFCNLFDLCAVAVPAGEVDGAQFGVTVVGRAFDDAVAADIARRLETIPATPGLFAAGAAAGAGGLEAAAGAARPSSPIPWPVAAGATALPLVVVGAHRKGQPLARELEELGAFWDGPVRTAARYRMVALDTVPPKPGVYRSENGAELVGEKWLLSQAALGTFLASLPEPMLLGSVRLADGTTAVGFACDAVAAAGGEDITAWGDWLADRSIEPKPRTVWRDLGEAALAGFSRGGRE